MKKWIAAIMFVVLVAFDQTTKWIAKINLQGKEPISLIDGILEFHYLEGGNTGAAFGLFKGKTAILALISLVVFLILVIAFIKLSKKKENYWLSFSIVLMASGALGNCIDRLFYHSVIDFIYFKIINFPIFNIADCYVTISAILIFLIVAFSKEEENNDGK